MSEIKIDLNEMSLLDVIKTYPEQVLRAIEQHNEEAQNTSTNSKSMQGCSECGCRISIKGYCAGCQSPVDW